MTEFIQQLINGISVGSIYALIALGYTMVYGIIKLINFAHGDVYMLGAFVGLYATAVLKMSFVPALIVSMIACAILGIIIERLAYRPLRNSPKIVILITAIGVSLLLEYTTMFFLGPQPRAFPEVFKQVSYPLLGGKVTISNREILIIVVTIILMLLLQYIVHNTKIGKAMRAVSYDMQAARLMGINVDTTISITFAIGSALAAAAGVLVGVYYNKVFPLMGIMFGLKAFVSAVLGGIGIIPGAMTGGLILGITESLVSGYGSSLYRDPVAFVILIIILLVKPSGIFGKNVREKV
ncbi:branched-chain amino acid ABC transporter permease [Carboxydothermus hydrogenoformans]|uniref:High affinity branched-chain amino acid ABC transporter, permease protein n=1 Tax=Carboxydothermus hydrogenoformans (strain ATCC BAA-161 / DSM 6008 / Z-2901) TaxID=246194 RepID=Q3A9Z0_CARHZ|nr:branched-chain amino acid ABC transporter permease [Carboxydothermus hydrogenoformans]ABB15475.1 high affinity branched-chain amino acid ABC transporter, permease protein [Carboxydothermus hydrogenoformans Z-2901]